VDGSKTGDVGVHPVYPVILLVLATMGVRVVCTDDHEAAYDSCVPEAHERSDATFNPTCFMATSALRPIIDTHIPTSSATFSFVLHST